MMPGEDIILAKFLDSLDFGGLSGLEDWIWVLKI
jgi:hypothetical protein